MQRKRRQEHKADELVEHIPAEAVEYPKAELVFIVKLSERDAGENEHQEADHAEQREQQHDPPPAYARTAQRLFKNGEQSAGKPRLVERGGYGEQVRREHEQQADDRGEYLGKKQPPFCDGQGVRQIPLIPDHGLVKPHYAHDVDKHIARHQQQNKQHERNAADQAERGVPPAQPHKKPAQARGCEQNGKCGPDPAQKGFEIVL